MRSLLRRVGIDVVAYAPRNYPRLRRRLLLRELAIDAVIDRGASDGSWAGRLRREGSGGRTVSIEPHGAVAARQTELEPATAYVGVEEVESIRRNDTLREDEVRVYLKLDLQGGELRRTLERTQLVEIERTGHLLQANGFLRRR